MSIKHLLIMEVNTQLTYNNIILSQRDIQSLKILDKYNEYVGNLTGFLNKYGVFKLVELVRIGVSIFLLARFFGVGVDKIQGIIDTRDKVSTEEYIEEPVDDIDNYIIPVYEGEKELLTRLVYAEAVGEPFEGKVAIANVVVNRVRGTSPVSPWGKAETITDAINEEFSCVVDGSINDTMDQLLQVECEEAVEFALRGSRDFSNNASFFWNPRSSTNRWFSRQVENGNFIETARIGNHIFYKHKDPTNNPEDIMGRTSKKFRNIASQYGLAYLVIQFTELHRDIINKYNEGIHELGDGRLVYVESVSYNDIESPGWRGPSINSPISIWKDYATDVAYRQLDEEWMREAGYTLVDVDFVTFPGCKNVFGVIVALYSFINTGIAFAQEPIVARVKLSSRSNYSQHNYLCMPKSSVISDFKQDYGSTYIDIYNRYIQADLESSRDMLRNMLSRYYERKEGVTKLNEEIDAEINELNKADPTGALGAYTMWIIRNRINGTSVFPDDKQETLKQLTEFHRLKGMRNISMNKDIMSYKTLADLVNVIVPLEGSMSRKETKDTLIEQGSNVVYNEEPYTITHLTTAEAAAKLCRGTELCVKDPKYYKVYTSDGQQLYLIHKNLAPYILFQAPKGYFSDVNNTFISEGMYQEMKSLLPNIGLQGALYKLEHTYETVTPQQIDNAIDEAEANVRNQDIYNKPNTIRYIMRNQKTEFTQEQLFRIMGLQIPDIDMEFPKHEPFEDFYKYQGRYFQEGELLDTAISNGKGLKSLYIERKDTLSQDDIDLWVSSALDAGESWSLDPSLNVQSRSNPQGGLDEVLAESQSYILISHACRNIKMSPEQIKVVLDRLENEFTGIHLLIILGNIAMNEGMGKENVRQMGKIIIKGYNDPEASRQQYIDAKKLYSYAASDLLMKHRNRLDPTDLEALTTISNAYPLYVQAMLRESMLGMCSGMQYKNIRLSNRGIGIGDHVRFKEYAYRILKENYEEILFKYKITPNDIYEVVDIQGSDIFMLPVSNGKQLRILREGNEVRTTHYENLILVDGYSAYNKGNTSIKLSSRSKGRSLIDIEIYKKGDDFRWWEWVLPKSSMYEGDIPITRGEADMFSNTSLSIKTLGYGLQSLNTAIYRNNVRGPDTTGVEGWYIVRGEVGDQSRTLERESMPKKQVILLMNKYNDIVAERRELQFGKVLGKKLKDINSEPNR